MPDTARWRGHGFQCGGRPAPFPPQSSLEDAFLGLLRSSQEYRADTPKEAPTTARQPLPPAVPQLPSAPGSGPLTSGGAR